jgi:GNAT superfamily N-acetyltransferase
MNLKKYTKLLLILGLFAAVPAQGMSNVKSGIQGLKEKFANVCGKREFVCDRQIDAQYCETLTVLILESKLEYGASSFNIVLESMLKKNNEVISCNEIGFLYFVKDGNSIFGFSLNIYDTYRNKGYGTILLQFLSERFKNFKNCDIRWTASPKGSKDLPRLIALYERFGGKVISRSAVQAEMKYCPSKPMAKL